MTLSLLSLVVLGLKPAIDFTGGSLLEVKFKEKPPSTQKIYEVLTPLALGNIIVQRIGEQGMILRFPPLSEESHQKVLTALSQIQPLEEERFESIGPLIGRELRNKSLWVTVAVLLGVVFYVAWAFRKSREFVSAWRYGLSTLVTLFHDIFITVGIFSVIAFFWRLEVGIPFVAALLTILGYSVNDTIVVFDRIRENLSRGSSSGFETLVDQSLRQTLRRSLYTSLTTEIVLLAIFFFGGVTIKYFVLTLIIGIAIGTYSSIFIASPLLLARPTKWAQVARTIFAKNS